MGVAPDEAWNIDIGPHDREPGLTLLLCFEAAGLRDLVSIAEIVNDATCNSLPAGPGKVAAVVLGILRIGQVLPGLVECGCKQEIGRGLKLLLAGCKADGCDGDKKTPARCLEPAGNLRARAELAIHRMLQRMFLFWAHGASRDCFAMQIT